MSLPSCVICGEVVEVAESQVYNVTGKQTTLLEKQLCAMFLLRDLLELPNLSVTKLFNYYGGENPSTWTNICGNECQSIVDAARCAYQEMCRARQKFVYCKKQIQDKVQSPLSSNHNTKLSRMIRETVATNSSELSLQPNDFSAGDRMAEQLLAIRLAILKQPTITPTTESIQFMESKVKIENSPHLDDMDDSNMDTDVGPVFLCNSDIKPDPEGIQQYTSSSESESFNAHPVSQIKTGCSLETDKKSEGDVKLDPTVRPERKEHFDGLNPYYANNEKLKYLREEDLPNIFNPENVEKHRQLSVKTKSKWRTRKTTEGVKYDCHHCRKSYNARAGLISHLSRTHNEFNLRDRCLSKNDDGRQCEYYYENEDERNRHMSQGECPLFRDVKEQRIPQRICQYCQKRSNRVGDNISHEKYCAKNPANNGVGLFMRKEEAKKQRYCPFCGKNFKRRDRLFNHMSRCKHKQ